MSNENTKNCPYFENCSGVDCQAEFCLKKYKLDNLFSSTRLGAHQLRHVPLSVDADKTDLAEYQQILGIIENINQFVSSGQNLFLHSTSCGVGKTTLAIRAIKAYINSIWVRSPLTCRALFVSVPALLNDFKDNFTVNNPEIDELKEDLMNADLVVWDDLGANLGSNYEINQLLRFIDGRLNKNKSNIYTSNLSAARMYQDLGDRLASRVCNYSIDIELKGKDKRKLVVNK